MYWLYNYWILHWTWPVSYYVFPHVINESETHHTTWRFTKVIPESVLMLVKAWFITFSCTHFKNFHTACWQFMSDPIYIWVNWQTDLHQYALSITDISMAHKHYISVKKIIKKISVKELGSKKDRVRAYVCMNFWKLINSFSNPTIFTFPKYNILSF